METHWLILYTTYGIIGIIAGILGGLLGISGGVITVPFLVFIFKYLGMPEQYIMHLAIGTSLGAMVFNATSATYSHHLRSGVLWHIFRLVLVSLIIGSLLGAVIARFIPSFWLQKIFGGFECLLAIYFFLPRKEALEKQKTTIHAKWTLRTISFFVSLVSNILGIGGGTFMVPTLMAFDVPTKKAIGTSAATGLVISFMGAISYLYLGIREIHLPDCIGFLNIPSFIAISITTFLAAPFGTKLAHYLSTAHLRRIFAIALVAVGIAMLL
jgi:uncharacterized protein